MEITYPDGSTELVEIPVTVIPTPPTDAEKYDPIAETEVVEEGGHGPAGVDEGLPVGAGVDPVVDPPVEGLEEVAVGLGGDEGAVLGAEVGARDEDASR